MELIETQGAELSALREYLAAQNASLEQIADEFETLKAAVAEERAAWQKEAEKLSRQNRRLSSPWAVGLFGGYRSGRREVDEKEKGLSENPESPVFPMVGDIGFEPTTSTV